ncbi:succinate dehydrogenase, hydrophobic membrane anchor protein [Methylomonas sp. MgM2]
MTSRTADRRSANHATTHFLHQRITSLLLIPLSFWLLAFLNKAMNASYADTVDWLTSPLNAAAIAIWSVAVIYHAALGVQVVIEDYVSTISIRQGVIFASNLCFLILGIAAVSAIAFILYTQGNYGFCI